MKINFTLKVLLCAAIGVFLYACEAQTPPSLKLWYESPADASAQDRSRGYTNDKNWLSALPVGNGSFGGMIYGDVNKERIQLNEESMWSGSQNDNDNPDSYGSLNEIRELLFQGKYKEAAHLTNRTQVCAGAGTGHGNGAEVPYGSYQTLGDLWLDFGTDAPYENYRRELDLNTAVATVDYEQDGVKFHREIFSSAPDQVMVVRLSADKSGKISFKADMSRPERYSLSKDGDMLVMSGALKDGKGGDGLQYMTRLKVVNKGGSVKYTDENVTVENADEALILLSASTDYKLEYPAYKGRDYKNITAANIEKASKKPYKALKEDHIRDHSKYFGRVTLELDNKDVNIPTDRLLKEFAENQQNQHVYELVFQFGRYLLISSSRPGTMPANLQGIWANTIRTPWNGDYHVNINMQMNYWPAEVANLSEFHLPMFDFMSTLRGPGSKTAKTHYGANGWVVHSITNPWGFTSPGEGVGWGLHPSAAAWMCQHIGEHYRFSGDKEFLKEIYPTLKGAVEFYMSWLVENPNTGELVSGPASSPENSFRAPDGSYGQITMGPAHDQQLIWQIFNDFAMVNKELGINDDFSKEVAKAQSKLAPTRIASDGRIMEWNEEFEELEPGHRHMSHLFAIYPGTQFNIVQTPEVVEAARKSMDFRMSHGGAHTGWSAAWLVNLYARLLSGEKAKETLDMSLSKQMAPNFFSNHPPFQIDGNFGLAAGIAEMLMQSHIQQESGEFIIDLLPALPAAWSDGSVKGLKARGNVTVDMTWKDGKLTEAVFTPASPNGFLVKYGSKQFDFSSNDGKKVVLKASDLS